MNLYDPVSHLTGVGAKTALALAQLGIHQIQHLLFHLPFRYEDKTKLSQLTQTIFSQAILVQVTIKQAELIYGRQKTWLCQCVDGMQTPLLIRFFNLSPLQREQLIRGAVIQCFAEVKINKQGLEMHHPEYRVISLGQVPLLSKTFTPVYHTTQGVYQNKLRRWVDTALALYEQSALPDLLSNGSGLWTLKQSLFFLHHPDSDVDLELIDQQQHPAQQRLIIEEFCAHRLSLMILKKQRQQKNAIAFPTKGQLTEKLAKQIKFELTNAQQRVIAQISADLSQGQPMLRLLQGDVGSGKTIVATFAALQVIGHQCQVAIMAPTELLAEQHFHHFYHYLTPLGIEIAYLTGGQINKEKKQCLMAIASGEAKMIIGTHALLQAHVEFDQLGLVIIDEQHRFGVHQRLLLRQKAKKTPHQLVMTATPIPRSLAMTAYADLDYSVIDELPAGRKKVTTAIMSLDKKQTVISQIAKVCQNKQQVYWVSTLIDESEAINAQAATDTLITIEKLLPKQRVALIHGQMKKEEKSAIMANFLDHKIDVLVATTVIEVGVDVANASLMIIENAERLGLAQLHQLRGRVGRGQHQSVCLLLYQKPLGVKAKQRLAVIRQENSGFIIAQKDLSIRGPGEFLGSQQTGLHRMKIADINRHGDCLEKTNALMPNLLAQPKAQQQLLINRWLTQHNLALGRA